ncbi:MAG: hypothetical protein JNM26_06685, partial [Ideonella sp.]|nr:hypothetical protein [Ideonella sp.]
LEDGTATVWDLSKEPYSTLPLVGHIRAISSASFTADGRQLVTNSRDGTVRLWKLDSNPPTSIIVTDRSGSLDEVLISPGGTLIALVHDKSVRLWRVERNGRLAEDSDELRGHPERIWAATFSRDGRRLVTASADGNAILWDALGPSVQPRVLIGHSQRVDNAAFSPGGSLIATASADRTLRLWRTADRDDAGVVLQGQRARANALAFSPDGLRLAAVSEGQSGVRLWSIERPDSPIELATSGWNPTKVAFSRDGHWLATGGGTSSSVLEPGQGNVTYASVLLYNLEDPLAPPKALVGHTKSVTSVTFSPDGGSLMTSSFDGTVRIWDLSQRVGESVVLPAGKWGIFQATFGANGRLVAAAGADHEVRLWQLKPGGEWSDVVLRGHSDGVNSVAFNPDGRLLASASGDGSIRVWDVASRRAVSVLEGHTDDVRSVSFSPDGRWILSASNDGTARLWAVNGKYRRGLELRAGEGQVTSASFRPDGKMIMVSSADGTVRLWPLPTRDELTTAARRVLTRCLTAAQRGAFGLREVPTSSDVSSGCR